MKMLTEKIYIAAVKKISFIFGAVVLAMLGQSALMVNSAVAASWADKAEMKHYIQQKYKVRNSKITLPGSMTANGYSGTVNIRGDLNPSTAAQTDTPEVLVNKFLTEEAEFLGVINVSDLSLSAYDTTRRGGKFYYMYFINGIPAANWNIGLRVDFSSNQIWAISGSIYPISQQMLTAANKPTLTKQQVRDMISGAELRLYEKQKAGEVTEGATYNPARVGEERIAKFLIPDPPYVVYKVESHFRYTINAFTGEVLEKSPGWVE